MAKKKVVELEPRDAPVGAAATQESEKPPAHEAVAATAEEARGAVEQVVIQSAASMARELISKSGGNYLAVKFLFEFAGLIGEATERKPEPSPLLRYYLEGIRNTKAASEANNGGESESV